MDWILFRRITAGCAAFACFVLGCLAYFKNRSGRVNRLFALSNFILGLWNLGDCVIMLSASPVAALIIYRAFFILGILIVPSFFYLSAEIAGVNIRNIAFTKILAGFGAFLIILLFTPWLVKSIELSPYREIPGNLYPLYILYFICWLGYGINLIFQNYRHAMGLKKNQLKYMLTALFFGFFAGVYYMITVMNPSIPPLFYIPEMAYTGIVAYAIIRYKVMDINLVFRYAAIYMLFVSIIGAPILVISWWAKSWIGSMVLGLLAVFSSPYLFGRLKSALTTVVDQFPPFKGRYEKLNGLEKLKSTIAQSRTLEEWLCCAVQAVEELFGPENAGVLLPPFMSDDLALAKDRTVLIRELLKQVPGQEHDPVIHRMDSTRTELCLPLFINGELAAILNVGRKRSGEMYNDLDLAVLWGLTRAAEETLRHILTRDELVKRERLAAIGEMASMVGHEIRTPLAVIGNSLYYLEKEFLDISGNNSLGKHLGIINAQVQSANKIVADILDYARSRELVLERDCINKLIRQTLSVADIPANVRVTLALSKDIPPFLFDKDEMGQVISNIVHNALEAMREGGTLCVRSALLACGKEIEIHFTDTGCGIPKENLERIFDPLFTTKSKGTGLGMAIVKKIVERHKGTIAVESEWGKGTTIIVRCPQ